MKTLLRYTRSANIAKENERIILSIDPSFLLWKKIQKKPCNGGVCGLLTPMPGQRHPDKTVLSVSIPRDMMEQLIVLARQRNTTVTEIVEYLLWRETKDVELTPEDHEEISRKKQAYLKRIDRRKKDKASGASKAPNKTGD